MNDAEKLIIAIEKAKKQSEDYAQDRIIVPFREADMILDLLKEQEAVKPRVSTVQQRCGNCNKVIEMDGWIACPWCGKPILWEAVGRSVKRE